MEATAFGYWEDMQIHSWKHRQLILEKRYRFGKRKENDYWEGNIYPKKKYIYTLLEAPTYWVCRQTDRYDAQSNIETITMFEATTFGSWQHIQQAPCQEAKRAETSRSPVIGRLTPPGRGKEPGCRQAPQGGGLADRSQRP